MSAVGIDVTPRRGRREPGAGRDRDRRLASGGGPSSRTTSRSPSSARSIQLIAIGYVIQAIFDEDSLSLVVALIAVMVVFGAFTARARAKKVPGALLAAR